MQPNSLRSIHYLFTNLFRQTARLGCVARDQECYTRIICYRHGSSARHYACVE
jgi:hypothetical protein